MRFAECYRLIRRTGFFWGTAFFNYRARFAARRYPRGLGPHMRALTLRLGDGFWARGWTRAAHRRLGSSPRTRLRRAALGLLRYSSYRTIATLPWAWAVLRYLRTRSYRGVRYRAGLPAHGQRTHTNASTTGRVSDAAAGAVRAAHWVTRVWEGRRRRAAAPRTKHKTVSRRAMKAQRHKRGVVRTRDKRKDQWR